MNKAIAALFFGFFTLSYGDVPYNSVLPPSVNPQEGFANVIEPIADAVVNISATLRSQGTEKLPDLQMPDGPFGDMFRDFFGMFSKNKPQKITSLGSGFIIDPAGFIVTNYHVVQHVLQQKGEIRITFNSGTEMLATVVGADSRTDLALLKVNASKPLTFLRWGNSDKMRVGDYVLAIGNPYGFGGTVTQGIVSAKYRNLPSKNGEGSHVTNWIQVSAAINAGNSGGPLVNMKGEVGAINTAIYTTTGANVGIAFAIPSAVAAPIIEKLKRYGCVKRGWIGVKLGTSVTEDLAKSMDLPEAQGVLIDDVLPKTPAHEAGLRTGDIILKIGKISVSSPQQVRSLVSDTKPGERVMMTIWRSSQKMAKDSTQVISIVVKEMGNEFCTIPSQNREKSYNESSSILGITLQNVKDIPPTYRQKFNDLMSGVMITEIQSSSPAIDKLFAGDIILAISNEPITSCEECRSRIQEALNRNQKAILIRILRKGEITHVSIPLDRPSS